MNEIKGKFLTFTDDEIRDIDSYLGAHDYTVDDKGLKEFIFDCIYQDMEDEKPDAVEGLTQMAQEYIEKNPAAVIGAVMGANLLLKGVLRKIRK
jgi:hypothetical protein